MNIYHWRVQVVYLSRVVIEETGDSYSNAQAWERISECLKRRGTDIANVCIGEFRAAEPKGNLDGGLPVELRAGVYKIP